MAQWVKINPKNLQERWHFLSGHRDKCLYLDYLNRINELNFDSANLRGKSGTLSKRSITAASISRLAAYWPSLTYQNAANGAIWEVRYNCSTGTADCWNNKPLNIGGLDARFGLAEVPYGRNLSGIFLFYQRDDNQLINYAWSSEANNWTIRTCLTRRFYYRWASIITHQFLHRWESILANGGRFLRELCWICSA